MKLKSRSSYIISAFILFIFFIFLVTYFLFIKNISPVSEAIEVLSLIIIPIVFCIILLKEDFYLGHYYIECTSRAAHLSGVWGALSFGLATTSVVGLLFQNIRLSVMLLPILIIMGYVIGCSLNSVAALLNIKKVIRVIFASVTLFGISVILRISLTVQKFYLPVDLGILGLTVSLLLGWICLLIAQRYRLLSLVLLLLLIILFILA